MTLTPQELALVEEHFEQPADVDLYSAAIDAALAHEQAVDAYAESERARLRTSGLLT